MIFFATKTTRAKFVPHNGGYGGGGGGAHTQTRRQTHTRAPLTGLAYTHTHRDTTVAWSRTTDRRTRTTRRRARTHARRTHARTHAQGRRVIRATAARAHGARVASAAAATVPPLVVDRSARGVGFVVVVVVAVLQRTTAFIVALLLRFRTATIPLPGAPAAVTFGTAGGTSSAAERRVCARGTRPARPTAFVVGLLLTQPVYKRARRQTVA